MRLLVTTQAVDLDDPVLGFFHRWIEELAKRSETVHVICLKEGRHSLPENVFVHSLGKSAQGRPASGWERVQSRVGYTTKFYRYIRQFRNEYDAVFVHMNQEYVLLGGTLWRLWGKRIVLWRNHAKGSFATRLAAGLSDSVCYTSPTAFVANYTNAVRMPIGIDTEFFSPAAMPPKPRSILFLGRLDQVKRVDTFVRALDIVHEQGTAFSADIVGNPTDPKSDYAHDVRNLASPLCLEGILAMRPAVPNDKARDLYRANDVYVNLTPSGSFDKTIGEAMASGCIVVAQNSALTGVLPSALMPQKDSDEAAAEAIRAALALSGRERTEIVSVSRAYIEKEHSLSLLIEHLSRVLFTRS